MISDELACGKIAAHPEYLPAYQRLVAGHAQHNVRAQLADDGLSAGEQVIMCCRCDYV